MVLQRLIGAHTRISGVYRLLSNGSQAPIMAGVGAVYLLQRLARA